MGFSATQAYLWLAAALVLLLAAGYTLRPKRRSFPLGRNPGLTLKLLTMAVLALAAAQPYWERSRPDMPGLTVLLDISESLAAETAETLLKKAAQLAGSGAELRILPFAGTPAPGTLSPAELRDYSRLRLAWSRLDIGTTNLEQALLAATAQGSSNILLLSDGFENAGDALRAAAAIGATGTRIFPLWPETAATAASGFRITALHAPLVAPVAKGAEVRLALSNQDAAERSGQVELFYGAELIHSQAINLAAAGATALTVPLPQLQEGIHELKAVLRPLGAEAASEITYIAGEAGEKILLLSRLAAEARPLRELLQNQAYQVEELVSNERPLPKLPALNQFEVVVLNNIPADELPRPALRDLEQYVKQGGGLLMIGGNRSFGLGAYINTPVEEALPVKLVPPRQEQKRLNVAVQLVLDKSGSMRAQRRMELLQAGVADIVRNLKDDDYLGILAFDSTPWVVLEMGQLRQVRDKALERIKLIFPQGRTVLLPAMDTARRSLMAVPAGRKHLVIVTDGEVPNAQNDLAYYRAIVREMRLMGITASTFMIGSEPDFLLGEIAKLGGGAFHRTLDPRNLPRLLLEDVKVLGGEQTQREAALFQVRPGSSPLVSTRLNRFPEVLGYVQTLPKDGAKLELVAVAQGKAEPLLASWQYGQGRAIAFTSDASGRWSRHWLTWPRFTDFWTDIINSLRSGREYSDQPTFEVRYQAARGELGLDVSIFQENLAAELQGVLTRPDGTPQELSFNSQARGSFSSRISPISAGQYRLALRAANKALTPVAFYLSGELFGEQKGRGFNLPLLQRLADISGGRANPEDSALLTGSGAKRERHELSPGLLLLAALLLCAAILRREGVKILKRPA